MYRDFYQTAVQQNSGSNPEPHQAEKPRVRTNSGSSAHRAKCKETHPPDGQKYGYSFNHQNLYQKNVKRPPRME